MRNYAVDGSQNVISPTDTVLGITSAATIRPEIFFLLFGCTATPADNAIQFLVQRYTAAGTGTAVTPQALDPADPAALASAADDHTVEPTYTAGAILLALALNQRGTYPWYAREGAGLKMPATAGNGIGIQPVHASFTGQVDVTAHFSE